MIETRLPRRELELDFDQRCEVVLNDISVMADIGALNREIGVRQPLVIHVVLEIVPPAEDELGQTFDYVLIHRIAHELADERTNLIETFAQKLAQRCMEFDLVFAVEVKIEKPLAVPGCMAGTRLRVRKARDVRPEVHCFG